MVTTVGAACLRRRQLALQQSSKFLLEVFGGTLTAANVRGLPFSPTVVFFWLGNGGLFEVVDEYSKNYQNE